MKDKLAIAQAALKEALDWCEGDYKSAQEYERRRHGGTILASDSDYECIKSRVQTLRKALAKINYKSP